MKKIISVFCVICCVAVCFTSCEKKKAGEDGNSEAYIYENYSSVPDDNVNEVQNVNNGSSDGNGNNPAVVVNNTGTKTETTVNNTAATTAKQDTTKNTTNNTTEKTTAQTTKPVYVDDSILSGNLELPDVPIM